MNNSDAKKSWEIYRERELRAVSPLLTELGFELHETQVHTAGERFLMVGERDVGGGGYKLVLTGIRTIDKKPVIIKTSSDPSGIRELQTERLARETLRTLKFAYHELFAPEEILYAARSSHTVFATSYIAQDKNFLSRPLKEQFALALRALKAQEGVQVATYSHAKVIRNIFGLWGAQEYLESFSVFRRRAIAADPKNESLAQILSRAQTLLEQHRETVEQYCGFLTHADFVPHNMRVVGDTTYLLDSASLHFGNKYESWARFSNFMLLYNRPLEEALVRYVHDNRTPEEVLALRLMRVYKLGKLLEYHTGTLDKTSGDLHKLSEKRVEFWRTVLEHLLTNTPMPQEAIDQYRQERDQLRTDEEKHRQEALH